MNNLPLSLPQSPRLAAARDIIARLQALPALAPYVYPAPFESANQLHALQAIAAANNGLICVQPGDLSNPGKGTDSTIRAARLEGAYSIACFCTALAGQDVEGQSAEEFCDRLATAVIEIIQGYDRTSTQPLNNPVVQSVAPVSLQLGERDYLVGRSVNISAQLNYDTITFS